MPKENNGVFIPPNRWFGNEPVFTTLTRSRNVASE